MNANNNMLRHGLNVKDVKVFTYIFYIKINNKFIKKF